ncbi:hypothetical protein BN14_08230 [Rhizoctonia solani AG-1 IB]|uniref:Fungal-type protein kinase domain-containing protein n=1 Tax=Thanatephorus cucumeris (strain AG1-IB / isolate 7/3/14) TaxID=1108050 RepID=M5C2G3_THACB|nr:hypothetical protein BN14_08230 [Rhizoctonia solani AG-1 IB]
MSSFSSPVKLGFPPPETLSAPQAVASNRALKLTCEIDSNTFMKTYINHSYTPGDDEADSTWSPEQQVLITKIEKTTSGTETHLYTNGAPLLCLLNSISLQVINCKLTTRNSNTPVLVFRANHTKPILNPITGKQLSPDIVVLWSNLDALRRLVDSGNLYSSDSTVGWSNVVAVGEVKVKKDSRYQLSNYLLNHLQFHPELSAVLGFTARSSGYSLMYHDASVVHCSPPFAWEAGPIYAFVERLYTEPFRDPSQRILHTPEDMSTYVTKIRDDVFVSECPRPEPGPGQRRFTTLAVHEATGVLYFMKDFWRDHLPGLMEAKDYGYVLDSDGNKIRTTTLKQGPGGKPAVVRYKMRVLTRDVGRSLGEIRSLSNGAILEPCQGDPEILAERTGTPKFIARSVSRGETLTFRQHRGELSKMPKLYGRALQVYESVHKAQYEDINNSFNKSSCPTSDPGVAFVHQLFHDAESTFWLIAWLMARSAGPDYEPEEEWSHEFSIFISALGNHYPSLDRPDSRVALDPSLKSWSKILHPDLASLATMLSQMHEYIEPEWAYRDGLDAEHAHEALMRLLLTEIVRIEDHPENDIPLIIGTRSLPFKLASYSSSQKTHTSTSFLSIPRPSATSLTKSPQQSQSRESTSPASSSSHVARPTSSNKRSRLPEGEEEESSSRPRRSPRLAELLLERGSLRDGMLSAVRQIKWSTTIFPLEPASTVSHPHPTGMDLVM